jgi:hypothetical protein
MQVSLSAVGRTQAHMSVTRTYFLSATLAEWAGSYEILHYLRVAADTYPESDAQYGKFINQILRRLRSRPHRLLRLNA